MKKSLATGGSVLSAVLAFAPAACCLGPFAFIAAGFGAAGFGLALLPYAPFLSAAALGLLGMSFYLTYRRRGDACEPGSVCATGVNKRQKVALWATAIAVVSMSLFPFAIGYLPVF